MSAPFAEFIAAADLVVRREDNPAGIVKHLEPLLRTLVQKDGWLPRRYCMTIPGKAYAQYLLHRPDDGVFSVVSFVWNPGQGSPVHDHCTWGVIGQYAGSEEESRFRRLENGALEKFQVAKAVRGDVSHVYPPNRDIHQIMNRSSEPAISIHIYGGDIGSQERHAYDPATGALKRFVSGYDPTVDDSSR